MKRVALLGATGSIGRQAIEVIDAHPELELVAAASGSRPIDGLAPLTQTGGDLTELLDRAEPDVVLNAVVGFAALAPTMWALEHGVTLALANKESLVAAGELALAAQERGGGMLIPVDSEHSALFQCAQLGVPESLVLTASGGPFRGRTRDELGAVTPEDALAHPTWSMGPKITIDSATLANKGLEVIEAHFLFGVPYDRIEVVIHPTSIVHGLVRFRDGAAIAHLGHPDMRVPISYALTYPERAGTPVPPLELRTLEFHEPDVETFRMLPLARESGLRGGTYPCAYNAANEVAVQAFLERRIEFLEIASLVEDVLARVEGAPARDLDELVEADRRARAAEMVPAAVSIGIAILALAVLVLLHEAGHFVAARAVGMTPRKFYLGFGPPLVKTVRGGVEYGIAALPLGGYVKIPGMHKPSAVEYGRTLPSDEQEAHAAELAGIDAAVERGDDVTAREIADRLAPELSGRRGWEDLENGLAEDAYWRQRSWKRIVVIGAGPATNVLVAVLLFVVVFMLGSSVATRTVERVVSGKPAATAGMRPGDRIVRVGGAAVQPDGIATHINATAGRPFTIVVLRDGRRVALGPLRARLDQGVYRVGFQIRAVSGPGESLPAAVVDALRVTGSVTSDTVRSIAGLAHGQGTRNISSSVGIVRATSAAFKQSLQDFLGVVGLISLALALLNMLPVLPLDGGHIVMTILERVRGRSFSQAAYMRYSAIGLSLFVLLVYLGLRNDLFSSGS